jgi:hypothetical protein
MDKSSKPEYQECFVYIKNLTDTDSLCVIDIEKIISVIFKCNNYIRAIIREIHDYKTCEELFFDVKKLPLNCRN